MKILSAMGLAFGVFAMTQTAMAGSNQVRTDRLTLQTVAAPSAAKAERITRTDRVTVVKFDVAEAVQLRERVARTDRVIFSKSI